MYAKNAVLYRINAYDVFLFLRRLRSSRRNNGGDSEYRAMGSPTSRNLLREFEAVSD